MFDEEKENVTEDERERQGLLGEEGAWSKERCSRLEGDEKKPPRPIKRKFLIFDPLAFWEMLTYPPVHTYIYKYRNTITHIHEHTSKVDFGIMACFYFFELP